MKKICIIGGGAAGISTDIGLRKMGVQATVCERLGKWGPGALGFILLPNGLTSLDHLGVGEDIRSRGKVIREFVMRSEDGREMIRQKLTDTLGIRRSAFLDVLRHVAPASSIRSGMNFSHFQYDRHGKAVSAHFDNGESLEADAFLGCDGVRSRVRKELFPHHLYPKCQVKELICMVHAPEIADQVGPTFIKTQRQDGGLAFGIVPCGPGELIWYLQFDSDRWDLPGIRSEDKQNFVESLVGQWPDPIPALLEKTDYYHGHIWHMTDMEPLPTYHKKNIGLVGDAAHIFLPFTSQGVNSALHDSVTLAEELSHAAEKKRDLESALHKYSEEHRKMVLRFVQSGRNLTEQFLHPRRFGGEVTIPLAS